MKKLMVGAFAIAMSVATANAECIWSWWCDKPAANADKTDVACALGIGSQTKSVKGAQVSLVYSVTEKVKCGAQGVVIGVNKVGELYNGAQLGLVNFADKAALQFGLINFNKTGFLPVFPFFNMSKGCFGKK